MFRRVVTSPCLQGGGVRGAVHSPDPAIRTNALWTMLVNVPSTRMGTERLYHGGTGPVVSTKLVLVLHVAQVSERRHWRFFFSSDRESPEMDVGRTVTDYENYRASFTSMR